MAVALYREDYGGGMDHGTVYQMALPSDMSGFKLPIEPPYRRPSGASGYVWYPKEDGVSSPALVAEWVDYSERCLSSSILMADFNFNDRDAFTGALFEPKKGIGVLLSGSIHTRVRGGHVNIPMWWDCK